MLHHLCRGRASRCLLALLTVVALVVAAPAASPAMTLMTQDNNAFEDPPSSLTEPGYYWAGWTGASMIRALIARDSGLDVRDESRHPSWEGIDRFVDTTLARDFQPYLTITYEPASWGGDLGLPATGVFGDYCEVVARRYRGRVNHYSVWNEPNALALVDGRVPAATYGALYRECYGRIKVVDATAQVYFGELAGGNCRYLTTAVAGSTTYADGFAVHPYQWSLHPTLQTGTPCSGIGRLGDFGSTLDSAWVAGTFKTARGNRVPLMVTEFGYCPPDVTDPSDGCPADGSQQQPVLSETTRGEWLAAAYDVAARSGVTVFSYYHLVRSGETSWDTGIVNQNGTRTPAVDALRTATGVQSPSVTADAVSNLAARGATLNGTVNPHGIRTRYRFEYGETASYGISIPVSDADIGAGTTSVSVSQHLSGLLPNTTYHYRIVATSRAGRTEGTDQTFRTRRRMPSFTGDGLADLVVADPGANVFRVATSTGSLLGGAGTGAWLFGWDSSPGWARAGDFDGDDKTDLIMADPVAGTYVVALSDGTHLGARGSGTWRTGWTTRPEWAEVGDFNGDGKDDLAMFNPSNGSIAIAMSDGRSLRGSGSGTWSSGWTGNRAGWGGVGDVNGDGKADIIRADPINNEYAVALSTGSQLRDAGVWRTGWSGTPAFAAMGDFNGDGKDDLLASNAALNSYAVAISNGTSLRGGDSGTWLTGWDGSPDFADVADFNGDGKDDLVVGSGGTNAYAVATSTGSQLTSTGNWLTGWSGDPQFADVGDLTGDGLADLVVSDPSTNSFAVATSSGRALGGGLTGTWLIGWDSSPDWARAGDFNGDDRTDVIIADQVAGTYVVALSDGSHLGARGSGTWRTGWTTRPEWAEVGDFNGDGKDDLAMFNSSDGSIAVSVSDGRSLRGPGSGTWSSSWTGNRAGWGGVGDVDGDGKADIIRADPINNEYAVATSTGTQFADAGVWRTGWSGSPAFAAMGDFNGDGKDDLLASNAALNSYAVAISDGSSLRGGGSGTWLTGWDGSPDFADVADFNGDGKHDLIVGSGGTNAYAVATSTGTQLTSTGNWLTGWSGNPVWAAGG